MATPDTELVSERVAGEIYPIAVSQARERVFYQAVVIGFLLAGFAIAGFRQGDRWYIGMLAMLIVSAVYDFRWWMWVRRAGPAEAFTRLQARTGREGGSARTTLTLMVVVVLLGLWWLFGR